MQFLRTTAHSDSPAALGHPLHQVQRADSLTNVDVVSSPALTVLGDLRAVQLCDQVLQDVGFLGTRGAVEVIGPPMIQSFVEVLVQQTGILGSVSPPKPNGVGGESAHSYCLSYKAV